MLMPSNPMSTPATPPSSRSTSFLICSRNGPSAICPPTCTRSRFRVSSFGPGLTEVCGDVGGSEIDHLGLAYRRTKHEPDGGPSPFLVHLHPRQHRLVDTARLVGGKPQARQHRPAAFD